ncbi:MAG: ROK family protein [Erysipelotrichaceae bacterium]|nr:ROK family protein [Erysipelotrichaceae bacterium]
MYLVFDVGGTFIKYGLLNDHGEVLEKDKIPTTIDDAEGFLQSMVDVYQAYKNKGIKGIAFSIPGLVDVEAGKQITGGAVKCLHGMEIGKEMSKRCDGINVAVENDGKCAALAEAWIGAAKDYQNSSILAFGTGIAGGNVINKHVIHGGNLMAGEASFQITHPDFANMKISQFGFYYSTIGILAKAKKLIGEDINGEQLFNYYLNGREEIVALMNDWFFNIACQCYNLQCIVDPDVICIGGGVSAQPSFVEGIRKYIDIIYNNTFQMHKPQIVVCKFKNDSNLIGALYNYKQMYENA